MLLVIPALLRPRLCAWGGLLLVVFVGGGLWWWRRSQRWAAGQDNVVWAYGRLQQNAQKLGYAVPPSQTPHEFNATILAGLAYLGQHPWLAPLVDRMRPHIQRLTTLFVARRYSGRPINGNLAAANAWRELKRPFFWLRIINRLRRKN